MIGCTLPVMMRTRGWLEHEVLMLLDEFQNLGRLGPIERDISLAGRFGVRLWLFVQDIPRLQDAYPRTWETFFTNTDVLQAFGASNDKRHPTICPGSRARRRSSSRARTSLAA